MCQKTKEYKLTNKKESKTISNIQRHETPVYSFCNFKNMLRTFLGFTVGKIKNSPRLLSIAVFLIKKKRVKKTMEIIDFINFGFVVEQLMG